MLRRRVRRVAGGSAPRRGPGQRSVCQPCSSQRVSRVDRSVDGQACCSDPPTCAQLGGGSSKELSCFADVSADLVLIYGPRTRLIRHFAVLVDRRATCRTRQLRLDRYRSTTFAGFAEDVGHCSRSPPESRLGCRSGGVRTFANPRPRPPSGDRRRLWLRAARKPRRGRCRRRPRLWRTTRTR